MGLQAACPPDGGAAPVVVTAPLSLLHVSSGKVWRGRERQVLALARGLAGDGHAVTLAAPAGSELMLRGNALGISTVPLPSSFLGRVSIVRRAIRSGRWNLHHAHDMASLRLFRWASLRTGGPRTPLVFSAESGLRYGGGLFRRGRTIAGATQIWAASEWAWSALVRSGIDEDRISVIHTGVDMTRFTMTPETRRAAGLAARKALGWEADDFVVGTVLHMTRSRGVAHLIEAVRMIHSGEAPPGEARVRLLIVGDGPARDELASGSARAGMGKTIQFTGPREDVNDLIAAMDVYVHPSAEAGGFPVALREAMAMALPVVATDLMGIREILDNGRHGLIAPVADPAALARNILRMRRDPTLASACGRLACLKAQRYAAASRIDRAMELYLRLIR